MLWYTVVYCGVLLHTAVCNGILWYTVVYCGILWYTVVCVCARISKKEAVALCWMSSECEESFLSSGSLMGSCREEGKQGRGERDNGGGER